MQELSYEKEYIAGTNGGYGIVFEMLGTKREHLELFNKMIFDYNGYRCYTNSFKMLRNETLDDLDTFKIITCGVIKGGE